MHDDQRNMTVFHNTTPDMQDQDQDRFFFIWDRSCPKTDGLSLHLCNIPPCSLLSQPLAAVWKRHI